MSLLLLFAPAPILSSYAVLADGGGRARIIFSAPARQAERGEEQGRAAALAAFGVMLAEDDRLFGLDDDSLLGLVT